VGFFPFFPLSTARPVSDFFPNGLIPRLGSGTRPLVSVLIFPHTYPIFFLPLVNVSIFIPRFSTFSSLEVHSSPEPPPVFSHRCHLPLQPSLRRILDPLPYSILFPIALSLPINAWALSTVLSRLRFSDFPLSVCPRHPAFHNPPLSRDNQKFLPSFNYIFFRVPPQPQPFFFLFFQVRSSSFSFSKTTAASSFPRAVGFDPHGHLFFLPRVVFRFLLISLFTSPLFFFCCVVPPTLLFLLDLNS